MPVEPVATSTANAEVWSPERTRSANTFSIGTQASCNTQVSISFYQNDGLDKVPQGGSGVFAINACNVPLRLRWKDRSTLVIAYPQALTPSKKEFQARNYADIVHIEYETYADGGERVGTIREAPLPAQAAPKGPRGPSPLVVNGKILRGKIVDIAASKFRYDYYDVHEPDSSYQVLHAQGYQGGGPSWAGIVYGLAKLRRPAVLAHIEVVEEGDGLSVWADDRRTLVAIAELVTAAKADAALLQQAINAAVAAGQME